ncbi:hypothetical protein GCM10010357_49020 [Streptomyces luteireticuli]|uniref:Uncharacterized protein n=1 Tax=Streptomyces luteireticuli TaxID=173858 RepID=A0ABP3ISK1_9ACTN
MALVGREMALVGREMENRGSQGHDVLSARMLESARSTRLGQAVLGRIRHPEAVRDAGAMRAGWAWEKSDMGGVPLQDSFEVTRITPSGGGGVNYPSARARSASSTPRWNVGYA